METLTADGPPWDSGKPIVAEESAPIVHPPKGAGAIDPARRGAVGGSAGFQGAHHPAQSASRLDCFAIALTAITAISVIANSHAATPSHSYEFVPSAVIGAAP